MGQSRSLSELMQGSMLISGTSIICLALLPPAPLFLAAIATAFGFFAGAVVALIAPYLVELVGIQNLPLAFGLCAAIQSPSVFLVPPMIASLRDYTGAHLVPFLLSGLVVAGGSCLLFFIPKTTPKETPK